jgi:hypothetical protein
MIGDRKLGLEVEGQRRPSRNDGAYVKDVKDPVEFQLPAGDYFLVTLRIESSRDCIPPAPFDDFSLNLRYSPAIKRIISELSKPCIAGLTHVVS